MSFVSIIMLAFSILGALDRIFGNRFGLGKEFERGFMLLGNMALAMIGMIVLSPLIATALEPAFEWVYAALHIDPSIIPASLFANDMGGTPLSQEVAQNEAVGMFNALVVSSMMGCTISFTLPYALGVVDKKNHKELFLGVLCGIVTIPVGCFVAGLMVKLPLLLLLVDLLPLILFAAIVAVGLIFAPNMTVRIFGVVGTIIKILITVGLVLGIVQFLTGKELVKGLADIGEGADICFNAAIVLSGAFPLMYIVSKILSKPIVWFGKKLKINENAAMGFVSTLVTNATTLEMTNRMDKKGVVLNSAFLVSSSFVFGSHLAFTMANGASYIPPMIVAKLTAGIAAFLLAIPIYHRVYEKKEAV